MNSVILFYVLRSCTAADETVCRMVLIKFALIQCYPNKTETHAQVNADWNGMVDEAFFENWSTLTHYTAQRNATQYKSVTMYLLRTYLQWQSMPAVLVISPAHTVQKSYRIFRNGRHTESVKCIYSNSVRRWICSSNK